MTDLEKLAVAQAVYKAVGEVVSTKDPESLRGRASARLLEQFQDKDAPSDRMPLMVNGTEVGSLSITRQKPTKYLRADVADQRDLLEGADPDDLREFILAEEFVESYALWARSQGILTPGVTFTQVVKDKPPTTTLRGCEPEKVAAALGEMLPAAVLGLIGAGNE